MNSINEFFYMGGYAFYVWSSYALALMVLVVNIIIPRLREREILRTLARKARRSQHDNPHLNS